MKFFKKYIKLHLRIWLSTGTVNYQRIVLFFGNKHEVLTVLVSGTSIYKEGKLLRVQRLEKASGTAQSDASYDLLVVLNLKQYVKALVFDTTASNIGWNNSVANCLEKFLDQKLLYNACRHYIYEFIIGTVYACLYGDSSAPDDANFKRFQAEWPKIDLSKDYHILEMCSEWLKEKSKLVICELQQIIEKEKTTKKAFVRGDYRQFVENTLALLSSAPSNFFYLKPGATSSAR